MSDDIDGGEEAPRDMYDMYDDDGLDSSSDEDGVDDEGYTYLDATQDNVNVRFDDTSQLLLANAKRDIKATLSKARRKLGLKDGEKPSNLNVIINLFLPMVFVLKFQDALNRPYDGTSDYLSVKHIESCIVLLMLFHFYRVSPSEYFMEGNGDTYLKSDEFRRNGENCGG
jgi:hypothetical protein